MMHGPAQVIDDSAAATIAALDAACPWLQFSIGSPRQGAWVPLDRLARGDALDEIADAIGVHTHGIASVAATSITGWTAYAVSWPLLAGPLLTGRRPEVTADRLWIGLHPTEAWLDRLAVAPTVRWHVCGAGGADAVDSTTATALVALLEPLVDVLALRRLLGRRTLWGCVADAVAYQALAAASAAGLCADDGMALGERLLAAMPGNVQPPQWLTVHRAGVERSLRLKQACCLAYKTPQRSWCTTCPLSDETRRDARLEDWLAAGAPDD
jgi:ferric iron reductase protein FhuF